MNVYKNMIWNMLYYFWGRYKKDDAVEMQAFKKSFPQQKSVVSVISHTSQQLAETNNTRKSYSIDQEN